MTGESFVDAVSGLAHILLVATLASNAIYEVVAFASDLSLCFILSPSSSALDPATLVKHSAENALEITAFILMTRIWFFLCYVVNLW